MNGENIDIKIREDGSRVVSRSMDNIADKAERAEKSVEGLSRAIDKTAKSGTSLERLKGMIHQIDSFNSTMVDRFGRNLTQYRSTLMKHFEMVSREAKASAASLKSQMEALTASPIGMAEMLADYRAREAEDKKALDNAVANLRALEQAEAASSAKRLAVITANIAERQKYEEGYTSWWAKEIATRERLEQQGIVDAVRNLKAQEEADSKSAQQRLKYASQAIADRTKREQDYTAWWGRELRQREEAEKASINAAVQNLNAMEQAEKQSNAARLESALNGIKSRKAAEEAYTGWWASELKKRDALVAANNLKSAQQRSGMQAFNSERMTRDLIREPNSQSALYAKDDIGATNRKTALQLAEFQATQRQMAMMQLLLPMIEREVALGKESETVVKAKSAAASTLASNNHKLAETSTAAADGQHYWNRSAKEGHALARGLSGSLGALWLTYGSLAPLAAGAAIGSTFMNAAKAGAEFSYQFEFVKQLGNESTESIKALSDQALQLATQTQYRPTEIANGYRILAQAGLDAKQSLQAMPDVLNLATAGELKLEQAGLAVVGTLNAFKLGMEQSGKVSDLFAKASAVSQSSVEDLTQSMRYASTTSTMYKQSVEDTMTALALLAKVNIVSTSAGTAYRNMLKEIYTPTKKAEQAWKQLGISLEKTGKDGQKEVKTFVEIMYELKKVMGDYSQLGQLNIVGDLFGERGSKEAAEMLAITLEDWNKFKEEISNSKGFAGKVTKGLNEEALGSWKIALNTLQVTLVEAFEKMEPEFVKLAKAFQSAFQSEEFKSTVDTILNLTLTLGNAFLDFMPVLYQLAKAWLVLKAAQLGALAASGVAALTTAMQGLAGGMLAASGAMGPVARGATMLGPLLAALGGPLTIILSLLAAGAAAWLLWGRNAETASGKAIKATETRLAELKKQEKFGDGELGAARAELETRENRLSHMVAARQSGKNLEEARQALALQQELVDTLERREQAALKAVKAEIPVVTPPKPGKPLKDWVPLGSGPKGDDGPKGRLSRDDDALAKLKARLETSKQEYDLIQKYGQAQFQLNEGQTKALEIQEKLVALEKMSTAELKEKGIANRNAQLASLKEQLTVANQLGEQLKQNEFAKVNAKIDQEVALTKMLPLEREKENKYIQFRNELLGKGVILDEAQAKILRDKVAAQIELNKQTQARDQFLANSSAQKGLDQDTQLAGLKQAQQQPTWTQGDTAVAADAMLKSMGFDTAMTQTAIDAQLAQVQQMYETLDKMKAAQAINQQTYDQLYTQTQLKEWDIRAAGANQFFGYMSQLSTSKNKELAGIGKAAAIAQATIDTYKMATSAYSSLSGIPYVGPALGAAAAAAAVAAGMANVDKIRSTNVAFATGGSFKVGGTGGVDSQQVAFRASPGERVTVSTPTQVRKGDELNKNQKQNSSNPEGGGVKILNVLDPNMLQDYLSTPAGERVLVNTIQRNAGAIRTVMNG